MRACIQRVSRASVEVDGAIIGEIEQGLVVLLGVEEGDSDADAQWMAEKTVNLRIFEDDDGKMNRSLLDLKAAVLAISQFTLLGDCRKGRRPSFIRAAQPSDADQLYQRYVESIRGHQIQVETGKFQAHMNVALVNDGPVTMLLDSNKLF